MTPVPNEAWETAKYLRYAVSGTGSPRYYYHVTYCILFMTALALVRSKPNNLRFICVVY